MTVAVEPQPGATVVPGIPLAFLPAIAAVTSTTATLRAARTEALRGDTLADHDAEADAAGLDELERRLYMAVRGCEVACGHSIVDHVRGVARLVRDGEARKARGQSAGAALEGYNGADAAA